MAFDVSAINSINSYNTLHMLLGYLYQVGFSAQTGGATGIGMLGNALGIEDNGQLMAESFADQQALNLSALKLRNAATSLVTSSLNSAYTQQTAASSDAESVTGTALANASAGMLQVGVGQLAQGQTVAGAASGAFAPTGVTTGNSGYGQLEFKINGSARDVTFRLNGTETNQEAFTAIAAAINERGIGITARVSVDMASNATLNLTGTTGAVNSFTVSDSVGNAAAFTGIGAPANVTQTARNSTFTVNGVAFSNASNQPVLANTGVQLNLLRTTGTHTVAITIGANTSGMATQVTNLAEAYNATLSALQSGTSTSSQSSAATLARIAESNSGSLRGIGITVSEGGSLSIDQEKLRDALANQSGAVNSAFGGMGTFAAGVQAAASNIINQPASLAGNFDFAKFYSSGYQSSFTSGSLVSSNMGLFINSFL